MYCLQWLIPVLLIPKPLPAGLLHNHVVFMVLYLTGFFLERKPCTICSLVFLAAVFVLCYSGIGNCLLWGTPSCQDLNQYSTASCKFVCIENQAYPIACVLAFSQIHMIEKLIIYAELSLYLDHVLAVSFPTYYNRCLEDIGKFRGDFGLKKVFKNTIL
ncbi:Bladder cancer-associated protein [Armadillidium vulgare]|nr:Bladder cancer-associated protein [Armadillidium vulgare]